MSPRRPNARRYPVHVEGWPEGQTKDLMVDINNGLQAGALVDIWSERRQAWICCRVLPTAGYAYIITVQIKRS
jgi:hypothetical protein